MCYFVDLKFMDNLILIIPMSNMMMITLFYFLYRNDRSDNLTYDSIYHYIT